MSNRKDDVVITLISTFPPHASGNVGDLLLFQRGRRIVEAATGEAEFMTVFRGEDLTSRAAEVNASTAVVMPGFAIRERMYPDVYRLVEELDSLKVPLVPLGAGWSSFPGDRADAETIVYGRSTLEFIRWVAGQTPAFGVRDVLTGRVLERSGIENVVLVGDCGWYDLDSLGKPLRRTGEPRRIVFTTPHAEMYVPQAVDLMKKIRHRFPSSEIVCSFHSVITAADRRLEAVAEGLGFRTHRASHDTRLIDFYEEVDLHIGYRLHGHIAFLSKRLPSVLLCEDGRANGFSETISVGTFKATVSSYPANQRALRSQAARSYAGRAFGKMARIDVRKWLAAPDDTVPERVIKFVDDQVRRRYEDYDAAFSFIDATYTDQMVPYVQNAMATS